VAGLFGVSIVIWFFQEVLESPGSGEVLAGIGMTLLFACCGRTFVLYYTMGVAAIPL